MEDSLAPSAKISCPHGRPILLEFREYPPPPLSVPIWLETKTVFLSKVAPLGANRNWPWQRARVKLVRGSVAAIPQCGISVGSLETYPSTARCTQPTPLFPDRTNAVFGSHLTAARGFRDADGPEIVTETREFDRQRVDGRERRRRRWRWSHSAPVRPRAALAARVCVRAFPGWRALISPHSE